MTEHSTESTAAECASDDTLQQRQECLSASPLHVVFVHPDLGIGGAERLVVDAAMALQRRGHTVSLWTAHHDSGHCFPETVTQLSVHTRGDWLPRSFCGAARALCAWLRVLFVCVCAARANRSCGGGGCVFVCDQVAVAVPLLRWLAPRCPVLFYCHFPDMLLSGGRSWWLKRLYRRPLDWLEERCTGAADRIVVNSRYTERVFRDTFPSLAALPVQVLYPALDPSVFDSVPLADSWPQLLAPTTTTTTTTREAAPPPAAATAAASCSSQCRPTFGASDDTGANGANAEELPPFLLSLNRYERKKNVALAIETLARLVDGEEGAEFGDLRLVVAGGYDRLNPENVRHYDELVQLCDARRVTDRVTLLRSPSDRQKRQLLAQCRALLYTPAGEHFGIVPLEAMSSSRPVVAADSGGPLETVEHNRTGLLCPPEPGSFAAAVARLLRHPHLAEQMGRAGRERVQRHFSMTAFSQQLNDIVCQMAAAAAAEC